MMELEDNGDETVTGEELASREGLLGLSCDDLDKLEDGDGVGILRVLEEYRARRKSLERTKR